MATANVVVTESHVIGRGGFDLEWLHRVDSNGVTEGWRVWCHPCGDYDPDWHVTQVGAEQAAEAHVHTVDPVAALGQMRREVPPLLGDEDVA